MRFFLLFFIILPPFTAIASSGKHSELQFHSPSTQETKLIKNLFNLDDDYRDEIIDFPISFSKDVLIAHVKLDQSNDPALIMIVDALTFCGTVGCELSVWKQDLNGWHKIGSGMSQQDVFILPHQTNGLRDIISDDNTLDKSTYYRLQFDGQEYKETRRYKDW